MDETIKGDVVQWAAFYEHRIRLGSKPIFHLEGESLSFRCSLQPLTSSRSAFCARIMSIHKRGSLPIPLPLGLH